MDKKNEQINYGKAIEDLQQPETKDIYGLRRLGLSDTLTLTKQDMPILIIPDHLQEDFVYLLSRVSAYDKFNPDPDDLKDVL